MAGTKPPHRKRIVHPALPGIVRELTFSCYRRLNLLDDDRVKVLLSEAIDRAVDNHGFRMIAFVYMPEHIHLIVQPKHDEADVSKLLYAAQCSREAIVAC